MSGLFGRIVKSVSNPFSTPQDRGANVLGSRSVTEPIGAGRGGGLISTPLVFKSSPAVVVFETNTMDERRNRDRANTAPVGTATTTTTTNKRQRVVLPRLELDAKTDEDRAEKKKNHRHTPTDSDRSWGINDDDYDSDDSESLPSAIIDVTPGDRVKTPPPSPAGEARGSPLIWREWVNQLVVFYEQLASALGLDFIVVCDIDEIKRHWIQFDSADTLYTVTFDRWILNTTFQSYIMERAWSIINHESGNRYERYICFLMNQQLMDWFVELCSIIYGDIRVNQLQKTRSNALTRQSQQRSDALVSHLCWGEERLEPELDPWKEIPYLSAHKHLWTQHSGRRPTSGHENMYVFHTQHKYAVEQYRIFMTQALGRINQVRVLDPVVHQRQQVIREQYEKIRIASATAVTKPMVEELIRQANDAHTEQENRELVIDRTVSEYASAEKSCIAWMRSQLDPTSDKSPSSLDDIVGDRMLRAMFVEWVALSHLSQKLHVNARYATASVLKRITNSREALQFTILDIYKAGGSVYYY